MLWHNISRPGYLGRNRDRMTEQWNKTYGSGNWRLVWRVGDYESYLFNTACKKFYEESYFQYLHKRPDLLDQICSYGEVIDNAMTNVESGLDYLKQESYSTHIQDIAVRNVMKRLERTFQGPKDKILTIRSQHSSGYFLSPGIIPFHMPDLIIPPSKTPWWAQEASVEDFWQSNKYLQVLMDIQEEMYE